jgi:hypothetical protein
MPNDDLGNAVRNFADCLYCWVTGCLLVQQQNEIDPDLGVVTQAPPGPKQIQMV